MHWLDGIERVNWWRMGCPDSISRNGGIGGGGLSQISGRSVGAGMFRRTIVGVDHVAGAASAGAVVAGLIVGAGKRQQRIEQASLLQSQKDRIGAQFGAEAALAQFDLRLARLFFEAWIPYFRLFLAAALEDAQARCRAAKFPSAAADRDTAEFLSC